MDTHPLTPPALATEAPVRRRRWRKWLIAGGVAAVVGVAVLLSRHHTAGPSAATKGKPDPNAPQTVTVAHATAADLPVTLTELGTVTPLTTVTVQSQISGYLTQIAFHEGQDVKRGDFLAQIDPRPYQAVLEQYQGNLIRDQALLRDAELDLARYQHLSQLNSISRQNVDTQQAMVAQYEGAIKTDQGNIDAQNLNIAYCHITAPSDGRVGLRQLDAGNYVTPSLTNGLVVLTQLKPISVIFTVPQTQLGPVLLRLRAAAAAHTRLPVTAYATDATTVVGAGSVETVDNQIDPTTGTVKLRAIFPNDDETLFPNQFVNAALLVDTVHNAVVVPNEAVQHGTPGTYVYLVGADKKVSLRVITTGVSAGDRTQVTSGLALGDTVVVDGTSRLRAGSNVTIVPAAGAVAAAAVTSAGPGAAGSAAQPGSGGEADAPPKPAGPHTP